MGCPRADKKSEKKYMFGFLRLFAARRFGSAAQIYLPDTAFRIYAARFFAFFRVAAESRNERSRPAGGEREKTGPKRGGKEDRADSTGKEILRRGKEE